MATIPNSRKNLVMIPMRLNRSNHSNRSKLSNKLRRTASNPKDTMARVLRDNSSITSFKRRSQDSSAMARRIPS
jgi:hypothetical protein